jgi:putative transposase
MLWAWLSEVWCGWRSAVHIIQPETIIGWHRRGFGLFWRWKSRPRDGRPGVPADVRTLIRELSTANPLWGAPRIHGELQKLASADARLSSAPRLGLADQAGDLRWASSRPRNHVD